MDVVAARSLPGHGDHTSAHRLWILETRVHHHQPGDNARILKSDTEDSTHKQREVDEGHETVTTMVNYVATTA